MTTELVILKKNLDQFIYQLLDHFVFTGTGRKEEFKNKFSNFFKTKARLQTLSRDDLESHGIPIPKHLPFSEIEVYAIEKEKLLIFYKNELEGPSQLHHYNTLVDQGFLVLEQQGDDFDYVPTDKAFEFYDEIRDTYKSLYFLLQYIEKGTWNLDRYLKLLEDAESEEDDN